MLMQLWQPHVAPLPGSFVRLLHSVEAQMQRLLLPPRRSQRSYPRAVKIKMSNYDRKRPSTVRGEPNSTGIDISNTRLCHLASNLTLDRQHGAGGPRKKESPDSVQLPTLAFKD